MSRRIVSTQLQAVGGQQPDTYVDRVVKNIPADVVAGWTALTALFRVQTDTRPDVALWVGVGMFVLLTAGWTWRQTTVPGYATARTQILIASAAFLVWAFALGIPFDALEWYRPAYGSALLIIYSLTVAIVTPPEGRLPAPATQTAPPAQVPDGSAGGSN